jgi:hypothetical protein
MYVMIVTVILATGFTNEQRLHPWPSLEGCQAALAAAVNTWGRTDPGARVIKANCERLS